MNYPLISEYIEAIKSAEDNFEKLSYLRPVMGDDGLPVMTSGNFAVVFKMKDEQSGKFYAVKCFTKEQEGRAEAYKEIAKELKDVSSTYLVSIQYLEQELYVDTDQTTETEFPVLLMDWVEGKTLDKYLSERSYDTQALEMVAYRFSQLANWLISQPFAHGDLKPDNILVRGDGTLVLVDYDGMYVPVMKDQKARELGSPNFCHPLRTELDFNEHIDDFPLITILLQVKLFSLNSLYIDDKLLNEGLLTFNDYRNITKSEIIKTYFPSGNGELDKLFGLFLYCLSNKYLDINFNLNRPKMLHTRIADEDMSYIWKDKYGAIYSSDKKRLLVGVDIEEYHIIDGTEIICDEAFKDCRKLKKIVIPESISDIGVMAFLNCESLLRITIHSGVTEIGGYTFSGCTSLVNIILPQTLIDLDYCSFSGCSSINKIHLPKTLKFVSWGSFSDCTSLSEVLIDSSDAIIHDDFNNCNPKLKVIVPKSSYNHYKQSINPEQLFWMQKLVDHESDDKYYITEILCNDKGKELFYNSYHQIHNR